METIGAIIIGAMIVEAIIEYAGAISSNEFRKKWLSSMGFGVAFALIYNLDLPAVFGLKTSLPFVGMALTGVLLSRGSNYLADFIKQIGAARGDGND